MQASSGIKMTATQGQTRYKIVIESGAWCKHQVVCGAWCMAQNNGSEFHLTPHFIRSEKNPAFFTSYHAPNSFEIIHLKHVLVATCDQRDPAPEYILVEFSMI